MTQGAPDYLVVTGGRTPLEYTAYSQVQLPVIMFDEFEDLNFKWNSQYGTISLNRVVDSSQTDTIFRGNGSLKCVSAAGDYADIYLNVPLNEKVTNLGISCYVRIDNISDLIEDNISNMLLYVSVVLYPYTKTFGICFNPTTSQFYYTNDGGATSHLIGYSLMSTVGFNFMKLVIDLVNNKAKYFIINGLKFDFDDVDLYIQDSWASSSLDLSSWPKAAEGITVTVYWDDWKVTYNEPV